MTEPVAPPKRGPGRPRKVAAATPQAEVEAAPPADAWKTPESPKFPPDERIGQHFDSGYSAVVFPDDRQYRIENGVIVERVR